MSFYSAILILDSKSCAFVAQRHDPGLIWMQHVCRLQWRSHFFHPCLQSETGYRRLTLLTGDQLRLVTGHWKRAWRE